MVDGPAFDNQQLRRRTTVTKTADIHKFIQLREDSDEDDGYDDDNTVIQKLDKLERLETNIQDKDEDVSSILSARPTGWSVKDLIETPKQMALRKDRQTSLLGTVLLLVICQLMCSAFLLVELFNFDETNQWLDCDDQIHLWAGFPYLSASQIQTRLQEHEIRTKPPLEI
jgi:hypothetical protein